MELNNQNTVTEQDGSRKNEIPMNQRYTLSLNLNFPGAFYMHPKFS